MKKVPLLIFIFCTSFCFAQYPESGFRIRTITAGINLNSPSDTATINRAIRFLKTAKKEYEEAGYEVQTLRVATQHFWKYAADYDDAIPGLVMLDEIAIRENIMLSIGEIMSPNLYDPDLDEWVVKLIKNTRQISFNQSISSLEMGVLNNSIRQASEIIVAISRNSEGGEGNFRFTATANCPPNIPFFPAALHAGKDNFSIGLESPNILTKVFKDSDWSNAATNLKTEMESKFKPLDDLGKAFAKKNKGWGYNGIDVSPAPGLDASIGEAIETLTGQPFGSSSTLRACDMITTVLKGLKLRITGYSGIMLPVIEDKVLAQRAAEKRFSIHDLLLFSSVSGTGLDVVPLPGSTTADDVARILSDVAALSLKYDKKALSARLFLIPGKNAGDKVEFKNPYLTGTTVMGLE